MNPDSPLARLAVAWGIELGYHDIWGNWHAPSEGTARLLLGAMGVAASTEKDVESGLAQRHASNWTEGLPPVCLGTAGGPVCLTVTMRDGDLDAAASWRLREENGAEHHGGFVARHLETLEAESIDGQAMRRLRLELKLTLPSGYHEASVNWRQQNFATRLIVAPPRCRAVPPQDATRGRPWGIALQLYGVRSQRNWGIGDLGDLARAATLFGTLGADFVAINPLHALYPQKPEQASPYSPSARCFVNPLYLEIEAIADFEESASARERVAAPEFQAELTRLRGLELVDYAAVAALKWPVLAALYAHFRDTHLASSSERARAFRAFQAAGGHELKRYAMFEVCRARGDDFGVGLQGLAPLATHMTAFVQANEDAVEYHEYLQWQLAEQISHAGQRAQASGMRIGLYRDLAVGSDAFGADVWGTPHAFAAQVSIGAPPDDFNLQGQVWGLPPWLPQYLEESRYAPFIATLRANMFASGALRIDHVIGLMRLFWVPSSGIAADGAFVRYSLETLLAILALESERCGCLIIGEDLGTVPDELRAALFDRGVLSYRVLYFAKHWHGDHSFLAPQEFPAQALVTIGTHDLPTFSGYWSGRDLDVRAALGLFPDDDTRERVYREREFDRARLLESLRQHELLPDPIVEADSMRPSAAFVAAVHRYVARTPAALMTVQMEDVLGELEQVNVPGTVHEQPNWRRRLHLPLEQWEQHAPLLELAAALNHERRQ